MTTLEDFLEQTQNSNINGITMFRRADKGWQVNTRASEEGWSCHSADTVLAGLLMAIQHHLTVNAKSIQTEPPTANKLAAFLE